MEISLLPDTLDSLVMEAQPPRTPGLHLSDIIKSILAVTEPGKYAKSGPIDMLYADPGFTWERVLETAWASRQANVFRPGEFTEDGIICSPDYIMFEGGETWLIESKMTEMSMNDCPTDPKFRKWLWQIAAYCYVLKCLKSRLHVLWLRGDYKKIRRAYQAFEITWTWEELEQIWSMLVTHARERGMLVQTPKGLVWSGFLPLNKGEKAA